MKKHSNHRLLMPLALVAGLGLGSTAQATTVPVSELETFLGLGAGTLDTIKPSAQAITAGSGLRRTLNVLAGDTLTFDYLFLTDEGPLGANNGIIDFAFFTVGTSASLLASVNDPLVPGTGFTFLEQQQGGYASKTINFSTAGTITLGFGVVDVDDDIVESGIVLDHFVGTGSLSSLTNPGFEANPFLTGWESIGDSADWNESPLPPEGTHAVVLVTGDPPAAVPVPAAVWLMGSALATVGLRRRRG